MGSNFGQEKFLTLVETSPEDWKHITNTLVSLVTWTWLFFVRRLKTHLSTKIKYLQEKIMLFEKMLNYIYLSIAGRSIYTFTMHITYTFWWCSCNSWVVLFKHQNINNVCDTVNVYFYLSVLSSTIYLHSGNTQKPNDAIFDIKILVSTYHFSILLHCISIKLNKQQFNVFE